MDRSGTDERRSRRSRCGYSTRAARDCYDVKVYLAPPESLRAAWKIKRDTSKRGYTEAQVRDQIAKRENDSESFIRPQRRWADMVVSFCPPGSEVDPASASPASANPVPETDASGGESQGNDLLLDVRLVLRPTISQPDLSDILANSYETSEAVRLGLTRDMGQPADLLEIDGHATAEQVQAMERTLCNDVARLGQFCSLTGNNDLGRITGTTGETLQSFPLAITQLLITYHMLKAARVQQ
ncbi:MAG: hypothetical protein HC824_18915 [Synechococcales cyanobacterium RM1_1_8]|nr:hypothetical protein [Synechococcales cyanobacterium RM1_1_8]